MRQIQRKQHVWKRHWPVCGAWGFMNGAHSCLHWNRLGGFSLQSHVLDVEASSARKTHLFRRELTEGLLLSAGLFVSGLPFEVPFLGRPGRGETFTHSPVSLTAHLHLAQLRFRAGALLVCRDTAMKWREVIPTDRGLKVWEWFYLYKCETDVKSLHCHISLICSNNFFD